jgi:hypothetical protein
MPLPVKDSIPPNLHFVGGYVFRLDFADPTTGNQVTGVKVNGINLQVENTGSGEITASDFEIGLPLLIGVQV